MIGMNIRIFRKKTGMTQEQLAEALSVSRQTIAKWENDEVKPNIEDCMKMQEVFDVSLDDLVKDMSEEEADMISPRGKHIFGLVTVGERGQIVLPKKARDIFHIRPGEKLLVLGDENQGIAIVKGDVIENFARYVMKMEQGE
ncbi:MAG: helix-turn-helix domain-containing protein [Firmicutes bacterium]|nr:helix-turn-helix domain-containing protein [Bacillota bacterium]